MHLVLALPIPCVAFDGGSAATSLPASLPSCQNQIISTVDFSDQVGINTFLEAIWSDYITNDRIKVPEILVLIFNTISPLDETDEPPSPSQSIYLRWPGAINIMDMHLSGTA